jgi:hypothetical protein
VTRTIEQYAADAEPLLPWTDDVSARLHKQAQEIFIGDELFSRIENHHERRKMQRRLDDAKTALTSEMVEHGKGHEPHEWDDHLCVEVYEPKPEGRTKTLPPKIRIFYRSP